MADPNFWTNITEYLDCSEKGPEGSNWTLDTNFEFNDVNVTDMPGNGTFCAAGNSSIEDVFTCSILNHPGINLLVFSLATDFLTELREKTFRLYSAAENNLGHGSRVRGYCGCRRLVPMLQKKNRILNTRLYQVAPN